MRYSLFFITVFILLSTSHISVLGQSLYGPMYKYSVENLSSKHDIFPYLTPYSEQVDSNFSASYLSRKLFYEHFLRVNQKEFKLALDPLMGFHGGRSSQKEGFLYRNTRGVNVSGAIGKNVSFTSTFYETQMKTPEWIGAYHNSFGTLPGETRPKGFKGSGYDFGSVYGRFAIREDIGNWRLIASSGYDHWFIGKGYRSLFLSDFSLPWFFGHVRVKKGDITYDHITGSMQNPNFRNIMELPGDRSRLSTSAYQKKTISFHYLNWQVNDWLSGGLFEATVFQVADTSEARFRFAYINPLPLSGLALYGFDGKSNVLAGLDLKVDILPNVYWYSQLIADRPERNSLAFHSSIHYSGPRLYLSGEFNHIGSDTYSSINTQQSYTHYNQPLGHPVGNNLNEMIITGIYFLDRWEINLRSIYIKKGDNTVFDHKLDHQVKNNYFFNTGTLRYVFNPKTRLQLFGQIILFDSKDTDETYFRFGLRTQLRNNYPEVLPD